MFGALDFVLRYHLGEAAGGGDDGWVSWCD